MSAPMWRSDDGCAPTDGCQRLQFPRASTVDGVFQEECPGVAEKTALSRWLGQALEKERQAICARLEKRYQEDKAALHWELERRHRALACDFESRLQLRSRSGTPAAKEERAPSPGAFGEDQYMQWAIKLTPPPSAAGSSTNLDSLRQPEPRVAGRSDAAPAGWAFTSIIVPSVPLTVPPGVVSVDYSKDCGTRRNSSVSQESSKNSSLSDRSVSKMTFLVPPRRRSSLGSRMSMFANTEAMKEEAKDIVWYEKPATTKRYRSTGMAQWVARHPSFNVFQLVILVAYSIWVGVDADHNPHEVLFHAGAGFQVVEQLFCATFFAEWLIRLLAFWQKLDAFKDFNFCFDSFVLLTMVLETWVLYLTSAVLTLASSSSNTSSWPAGFLAFLRVVRLTRAIRITRLLQQIPEFAVILRGLKDVTKSVLLICILLTLLVYVFAILFAQLARDTELADDMYRDVPSGMINLVLGGLIPDVAPMAQEIAMQNVAFAALFLLFVIVGFLVIMNMLIGVLVQVIGAFAQVEAERRQLIQVKTILMSEASNRMSDENDLTQEDVEFILADHIVYQLRCLDIDTDELATSSAALFKGRQTIKPIELFNLAVQLRGNTAVRVKDLVHMRRFFQAEINSLKDSIMSLQSVLDSRRSSRQDTK